MTLGYLTNTQSEEEYIALRFKQAYGTGGVTRAAINNAKLFCKDAYNRELIIVMKDIREEVESTKNLDTALVFLQNFINWAAEDHLHIMSSPTACNPEGLPYYHKDSNTILIYVSQLRLYMKKVSGIQLSSDDVKDYNLSYPPAQEKEEAEPLELEEFRLIVDNETNFRRQMLYRIMKDCEARIGAMVQLRKRNFDITVRPIQVTFPKNIVKKSNGKSTTNIKFVIAEDEKGIIKLLSKLKDDDLVFGTNENVQRATNNEQQCWAKKVQQLGFTERYAHNNHLKKNIHAIKAMTFTAAEEHVNITFAHAYGDHTLYTKTYLRWNLEKKVAKFRQLEPHISVYQTVKIVHDAPELFAEKEHLKKKLSKHDDLLEKISQQVRESTAAPLTSDVKKIFKTLLREHNLI